MEGILLKKMEMIKNKRDELEEKAADLISESFGKMIEKKDKVIFGIVGGRSVSGIFERLKDKEINWEKVHIFMVDERLVSLDDLESNFRIARNAFIHQLIADKKLPQDNVHPFIMNAAKNDLGIGEYEKEFKEIGEAFDVILLSSGEDGHVGALYPNHHSIEEKAEYFITMDDSPKEPPKRMTASRKLLEKSKVSLLLFFGEDKRDAFKKFNDGSLNVNQCPCKLVNKIKESYILTDVVK